MASYLIETQQNSDSILKNLLIQLLRHQKETLIQYSQTDFLLANLPQSEDVNLYFISINMDEKAKKHLQFIEHIHHLDNKGQLVLITNSDANKETLKAKWPSIIVLNKNEYFMRFASNVEMQVNYYFQRKHQTGQNSLIIKDRCRLIKIPLKYLRYIESKGMHKIRFVGPNLQYEFYLPLNQVEVLHEDLLRIHRSFIVNKHAVKDVSRGKRIVQLKDNTLLPLSRTYFSEVIDDLEKVCQ